MPAKSKAQQRLFGMVHAYQKGEFHGNRALRRRVANLAKRISGEDAKHFAQTPHTGLPEKKASEEYTFPGDRVRIFKNIRSRHAGKTCTVISTNHGGADKARQVSVFKTDDGSVFSGYTDSYVAANLTSKAAEKVAQVLLRPEAVQALAGQVPLQALTPRSERRRSVLGRIFAGAAAGAALGGLGFGALGVGLAHAAGKETGLTDDQRADSMTDAGVRCGLWGAGRGALAGAITGIGLSVLDKVRGDS